jgi:hypothetical protein
MKSPQNQAKTHKIFQNFPLFFKELVFSRVLVFKTQKTKTKTQNLIFDQNQNEFWFCGSTKNTQLEHSICVL